MSEQITLRKDTRTHSVSLSLCLSASLYTHAHAHTHTHTHRYIHTHAHTHIHTHTHTHTHTHMLRSYRKLQREFWMLTTQQASLSARSPSYWTWVTQHSSFPQNAPAMLALEHISVPRPPSLPLSLSPPLSHRLQPDSPLVSARCSPAKELKESPEAEGYAHFCLEVSCFPMMVKAAAAENKWRLQRRGDQGHLSQGVGAGDCLWIGRVARFGLRVRSL